MIWGWVARQEDLKGSLHGEEELEFLIGERESQSATGSPKNVRALIAWWEELSEPCFLYSEQVLARGCPKALKSGN